jgi:hypothetical protein
MKRGARYGIAFAVVFAASAARVALGDDRGATGALVEVLDHDALHKAATAELVRRARAAIERATRLRAAGDEEHAELADGLARQDAETARDLVRAVEAERAADEARRAATDAGVVGDRERALLEEGIARNGRLRAEIGELGRPVGEARTAKAGATIDAGAARPAPGGASAPRAQLLPGASQATSADGGGR